MQINCPRLPIKFVTNHFLHYKGHFADYLSLSPFQICPKSFLALQRLFSRHFVPTSLSNLSHIISCNNKVILQTVCPHLHIKFVTNYFLHYKGHLQTFHPYLPIKSVINNFLHYKGHIADYLSLPPYQNLSKLFLLLQSLFCRLFVPASIPSSFALLQRYFAGSLFIPPYQICQKLILVPEG